MKAENKYYAKAGVSFFAILVLAALLIPRYSPGTTNDPSVEGGDCRGCHGSPQEVAELTADRTPNPHDSLHYGPDLDCDLCHHLHGESENFCNQCHEFDFVVP